MATQTTKTDTRCHFDCPGDEEAIQDLDVYLLALWSYPDQFADQSHLSFQQHLQNVMQAESRRADGYLQS